MRLTPRLISLGVDIVYSQKKQDQGCCKGRFHWVRSVEMATLGIRRSDKFFRGTDDWRTSSAGPACRELFSGRLGFRSPNNPDPIKYLTSLPIPQSHSEKPPEREMSNLREGRMERIRRDLCSGVGKHGSKKRDESFKLDWFIHFLSVFTLGMSDLHDMWDCVCDICVVNPNPGDPD
ncbi:hypothetical protein FQA39_LY16193 [Lamprigera yunnana]|nr:hypothetical protein FQA39_LY16193 [Lamprigera yunnana]